MLINQLKWYTLSLNPFPNKGALQLMNKGKGKVTIQDIADSLGLSRNTVSKALNNSEAIPTDTRNIVIKRAIELNYKQFAYINQESSAAKSTGNIALLTSNMPYNSHFGASLLSGLEQKISSEGYNLSIHMIRETEIEALVLPGNFDKNKVDGIVCIELFDKNYTEFISTLGIPSIFIDSSSELFYPGMKTDLLLMENEYSTYCMTKKLIEQGCNSLGFVGDYRHCKSFNERWTGFQKALSSEQIKIDPSFLIVDEDRFIADYKWLEQRVQQMEALPSALVCSNDYIAINVMRILKNKNIRIPEDIMICGFDNSTESQIIEPHLTTAHIYRDEMGLQAAEMLLSRIQNPDKPAQIVHFQTTPIFRSSTGYMQ
jgi:LacI family transcriptional regulator